MVAQVLQIADDVVGCPIRQVKRLQHGSLDALAAAVGEDEHSELGTQVLLERIGVAHADPVDPHIDTVVAHRSRQDEIELLLPNEVEVLLARPRVEHAHVESLLCVGRPITDENGQQRETEGRRQRGSAHGSCGDRTAHGRPRATHSAG